LERFQDAVTALEAAMDVCNRQRVGFEKLKELRLLLAKAYVGQDRLSDAARAYKTALRDEGLSVMDKCIRMAELNDVLFQMNEEYGVLIKSIDEQLTYAGRLQDLELERRGLELALELHMKYHMESEAQDYRERLRLVFHREEMQGSDEEDFSEQQTSDEPPSAQTDSSPVTMIRSRSNRTIASSPASSPISQLRRSRSVSRGMSQLSQHDRPIRRLRPASSDIPTSEIAVPTTLIDLSTPEKSSEVADVEPIKTLQDVPQVKRKREPSTPKMSSDDEPVPLLRTATKIRDQRIEQEVLLRSRTSSPLPSPAFRVRVRFDFRGKSISILVPVLTPTSSLHPDERTVDWLKKEALRRFHVLHPSKRIKVSHLMTEDEAALFPEDFVMETLQDNQQVVAVLE
jgi:hypothetical protein